jgi:hypothetical protein
LLLLYGLSIAVSYFFRQEALEVPAGSDAPPP